MKGGPRGLCSHLEEEVGALGVTRYTVMINAAYVSSTPVVFKLLPKSVGREREQALGLLFDSRRAALSLYVSYKIFFGRSCSVAPDRQTHKWAYKISVLRGRTSVPT